MGAHSKATTNHRIYTGSPFASIAARDAATYNSEDQGKVFAVSETPESYWILVDHATKTFRNVAPIEEGTVTLPVGTRADVISGSGLVDISSNNDMPALAYRWDGGAEAKARWSLPVPKHYQADGIKVKVYYTVPADGVGGSTKGIRWGIGYAFTGVGDDLGSYTEIWNSEQAAENTWTQDELREYEIGTVPHAAIDKSKERFFLKVSRDATHADDDLDQDAYVHAIVLEFTGRKFSDFTFQL